MLSIQSASPDAPKPGCVGAHTVKRSATWWVQRVKPRLPPAPWSTSSGSPRPPTHACTSMLPTRIDVHAWVGGRGDPLLVLQDRESTRLNSSHSQISYSVFCLKKKKTQPRQTTVPRD